MKDIQSIELCFENCDVMVIPVEFLTDIVLKDIRKHIRRTAVNAVWEYEEAEYFKIEVKKEFDGDFKESYFESHFEDNSINRFQRISYNDVVLVRINFDEKDYKDIYVKWGGESNYQNERQSTSINDNGDLVTIIK